MRALVDAQLPPALARQIEARGHTAEHVADCGLATAADRDIRAYAVAVAAVIITKEEHFVVRKLLESGPPVVWVRVVTRDGLICSAESKPTSPIPGARYAPSARGLATGAGCASLLPRTCRSSQASIHSASCGSSAVHRSMHGAARCVRRRCRWCRG